MKTLKLLSVLLSGTIIYSCSSDKMADVLPSENFEEEVQFVENPYAMSEEAIKEKALSFITDVRNDTRKSTLRSSDMTNIVNASVETENYDVVIVDASEAAKQTIPVYTVNYKDDSGEDAGYVMLVGDERFSDNVLIFSEEKGVDFNMDEREDADFLKDMIAGYLHKNINFGDQTYEEVDAISTRALQGHVHEYGNAMEYLLPYWVNFGLHGDPFNRYTPYRGGKRSQPGCAAVAMSEIMAYHGWPLHGTFKRYTTNTSTPETVTVSYQLTEKERGGVRASNMEYCKAFYPNALEYVANLLVETGYRLNSNYGTDITLAYPNNVPSVFMEMGYTTDVYQEYSYSAIANDIENRELPVYMAGWKKKGAKDFGGHAYVIYGTYHRNNGERFIFLVEGNNAEGHSNRQGSYQDPETGYYYNLFNAKVFSTNQNEPVGYTPSIDFPDIPYPYRYECKIITNIKPNPNKTGSTNSTWRVSSHFSY